MARQSVNDSVIQPVSHSVTQSISHQADSPCLTSQTVSQSLAWQVMPCLYGQTVSQWLSDSASQPLSHSVTRQIVLAWLVRQQGSHWHGKSGPGCLTIQSVTDSVFQPVSHSVTQSPSHQTDSPCLTSQAVSQSLAWQVRPCLYGQTVSQWLSDSASQSPSDSITQSPSRQSMSD